MAIFTGICIFTAAVNNEELVKIEGSFGSEALRILRAIPGITVINDPDRGTHRAPDAVLRFAGRRTEIAVEIKRRANAATAWQLVHYAEAHPATPLLLIADQTTADARTILANHGIAIVDGLGNVRVKLPGLLLHLEGHRSPTRPSEGPPTRLNQKAGIVAEALLLKPEHPWRVQDLARDTHVSPGLAHRVLARLEREGILISHGSGPNRVRLVKNLTALLDLWTEENVEKPSRTLGHLLAQTPRQLVKELGTTLDRSGIEYAITGAAAANLLAPFVTAIPVVEVWTRAVLAPADLCKATGADHVTEGHNIVFLQTKNDGPLVFRQRAGDVWLASRFRIYADLRRDPRRGQEQAEHLRREVITV